MESWQYKEAQRQIWFVVRRSPLIIDIYFVRVYCYQK